MSSTVKAQEPLEEPLPPELLQWEARGRYVRVGPEQHAIYTQSVGASSASADHTLLLVHGYPESSFSFARNVDALARRFERVVLVDLLGYGLSDKPPGASYSLFEQADLLLVAWKELGVTGGHLLGHDMGDSVMTELVARDVRGLLPAWMSEGLRSLTFTDGSMVMSRARLRLGQRLLRTRLGPMMTHLSRYAVFAQQVKSASGGPIDDRDIALMWAAIGHGGGRAIQHRLIGYIDERLRFEQTRWLPALAATRLPIHLCWGELDRVAPPAIARHLKAHVCPGATLTLLPKAGHFCQQEDSEAWNDAVLRFWQR